MNLKTFWIFAGLGVAITGAAATPTCASDAPRVVKATPDHGDTNVDPNLAEIRVEFDRDMRMGSHSWVGGGETFPELVGKPKWINKRVAVLPVKLKPNHSYWLSINSNRFRNFKATDGTPATLYPISFTTGNAGSSPERSTLTPTQNQTAIKKLRQALDDHYSYRDRLGLDWDELFAKHAPALEQASSPVQFARAAGKLLASAEDLHIRLEAGPAGFASYARSVAPNCNFDALPHLVPGWQRCTDAVYTGRFEGGSGYVMITTWSAGHQDQVRAVLQALKEMKDAPALIIDVRLNSGGDEYLARQVAGCFVDSSSVYAKHTNCDPQAPNGFTAPPYERVLKPNPGGPAYRGPVAVLMGPVNMSSCEAFLLMMKQVPKCRLIGARSYGSSGRPRPHDLGNGVTVYLPSWKALRPDGTCYAQHPRAGPARGLPQLRPRVKDRPFPAALVARSSLPGRHERTPRRRPQAPSAHRSTTASASIRRGAELE